MCRVKGVVKGVGDCIIGEKSMGLVRFRGLEMGLVELKFF